MLTAPTRECLVELLPKQAVVAEIGVQRGKFARVIYRRSRPARLHLIDCWEQQDDAAYQADTANVAQQRQEANLRRVRRRLAKGLRAGRVEINRGFSTDVLPTFPDGYFDWVYVDANHTYDAVLADLEAVLPKMKPGGVIAGHDFIDTPYWRQLNYGVAPAVAEFCRRHGWELIYTTLERGHDVDRRGNPSFALRAAGLGPPQVQLSWWRRLWIGPALRAA